MGQPVVCIHGVTQHSGAFEWLASRLAKHDQSVTALDLRGHGASGWEPPWNTSTHVGDVIETLNALEIQKATWIGHSFGGLVAAAAAVAAPERVLRLVLLDPGLEIPPDTAFARAEMDRIDWAFESADGAVNALLASEIVIEPSEERVAEYVAKALERGPDQRLRFCYCPSAAAAIWSETTLPAPPVAKIPTLIVRPVASFIDGKEQDRRYREELGSLLRIAAIPNGHNVLWEWPVGTAEAIETFLLDDEVADVGGASGAPRRTRFSASG
jgi:pimeloyl-ACP methyl ester carboxylesterase